MRHLTLFACIALMFVFAAGLPSQDKKLMHCFYFTPIASATQADWDAFFKATDAIPTKIPEVTHVWYGKLRAPQPAIFAAGETNKKMAAAAKEQPPDQPAKGTGDMERWVRSYGVCMEMANAAALKTYAGHPYHKDWEEAYAKVRVPHTNTYDIIGQ
jgi:hypothetical protein